MRTLLLTSALACSVACGPPDDPVVPVPKPPPTAQPKAETPLLHAPVASYGLDDNPQLLARLVESPYAYFRFTNLRFANMVCMRFADAKTSMPLVNLHGDAHLEQYAVTSHGRGLADYDDASTGPAILDLVRFSVSLRLAARERGWTADAWIDAFIAGYRAALTAPDEKPPPPSYVERIEATFKSDRLMFLEEVEALMASPKATEAKRFEEDFARYVKLMQGLHQDLPAHFFDVRKYGRFHSGVGSALRKKFLVRIEGDTKEPGDDLVLEVKELSDLGGISCITAAVGGGAFRILLGQTRIGGQNQQFLAQIPRGPNQPLSEQPFWVQKWRDNYHELSLADPALTKAELGEISRDVGVQLGRGHVMKIADPMGAQLRQAQLTMLMELEPRLRAGIDDMTALTLSSWKAFTAEVGASR